MELLAHAEATGHIDLDDRRPLARRSSVSLDLDRAAKAHGVGGGLHQLGLVERCLHIWGLRRRWRVSVRL